MERPKARDLLAGEKRWPCDDPIRTLKRLLTFAREKGIVVRYAPWLAGANGRSYGGHIQLLAEMTVAQQFTVLTHELAHEMLHWGGRRLTIPRRVCETEAKAVAFVVCDAVGLNAGTQASAYMKLVEGDAAIQPESLDFVEQTAAEILAAIK